MEKYIHMTPIRPYSTGAATPTNRQPGKKAIWVDITVRTPADARLPDGLLTGWNFI